MALVHYEGYQCLARGEMQTLSYVPNLTIQIWCIVKSVQLLKESVKLTL